MSTVVQQIRYSSGQFEFANQPELGPAFRALVIRRPDQAPVSFVRAGGIFAFALAGNPAFVQGESLTVEIHTFYEPPVPLPPPSIVGLASVTSASLNWNEVVFAQAYDLQWHGPGETYNTTGNVRRIVTQSVAVVIFGLQDSALYHIRIKSLSSSSLYTDSLTYDEIMVNTISPSPPQPTPVPVFIPQNIQVVPTFSTLAVSWDPEPRAFSYSVQWRLITEAWSQADRQVTVIGITNVTIASLVGNEVYQVRVRAEAGPTVTQWSAPVTAITQDLPLDAPVLSVLSADSSIIADWMPIDRATHYEVQWAAPGQVFGVSPRFALPVDSSYAIAGLTNGTLYRIRVRAHGPQQAFGDWSAILGTTPTATPSTPVLPTPGPTPKPPPPPVCPGSQGGLDNICITLEVGQSPTVADRYGYQDSLYGSVDTNTFALDVNIYRILGIWSSNAGVTEISLAALAASCEYLPTQLNTVSILVSQQVHSSILDYASDGCHVTVGFTDNIFEGRTGEQILVILRVQSRRQGFGTIEGETFHEMLCKFPTRNLGAGSCTPVFMATFAVFFVVIGLAATRNPMIIAALAGAGLVGGIALTVSSPILIFLALIIAIGVPASVILLVRRGS